MYVSAFSVELKVRTPIIDSIDCQLSTGEQSRRKVVGLLERGSKTRRYTPVHQCTNDGVWYLRGQWWLQTAAFFYFVLFVDNNSHALLTDGWAILIQWQGLVSFPLRKHHKKSKTSSHKYMKM